MRVEGKLKSVDDFSRIIVARRGGNVGISSLGSSGVGDSPVYLGQVATVVDGEQEAQSIGRNDGAPALTVGVYKIQDANIVETGEAVAKAIADLSKRLPPGVEIRKMYANSDWVKRSLDGVKHTLVEGGLLTVLIVFLFLRSWRSTIITGLTLPIAVMSTFIVLNMFHFTLNFMTMMALSLCIGLLIDDAIVVRENIVRHLHMGKSHRQAAEDGTNEIGLAVMATTFAIVAVFVPVAFMSGIVGKFFFSFGITVTAAVLVSLFVSFTLDPMLSSIWHDPAEKSRILRFAPLRILLDAFERFIQWMHRVYGRLLGWALSARVYRLWLPGLPALRRPRDAVPSRDDHAARHRAVDRVRIVRRRVRAARVRRHRQRVHPRRRPELDQPAIDHAARRQPRLRRREVATGRGRRRRPARSDRDRRQRVRRGPDVGAHPAEAEAAQRAPPLAEGHREGDPRSRRGDPRRHAVDRLQPGDLHRGARTGRRAS